MSSSIIVCQIAVARMKKGGKNDSKWWKTIYLPDNEAACASLFFKKPLHFSWNQLRSDANSFDNEDNKLLLLYIYFPVCFLFSFLLFSVCLPNEQNSDGALVERVDAYQHKLPILESLSAITHASLLLSPRKNQLTNDKRRRKEAKKFDFFSTDFAFHHPVAFNKFAWHCVIKRFERRPSPSLSSFILCHSLPARKSNQIPVIQQRWWCVPGFSAELDAWRHVSSLLPELFDFLIRLAPSLYCTETDGAQHPAAPGINQYGVPKPKTLPNAAVIAHARPRHYIRHSYNTTTITSQRFSFFSKVFLKRGKKLCNAEFVNTRFWQMLGKRQQISSTRTEKKSRLYLFFI